MRACAFPLLLTALLISCNAPRDAARDTSGGPPKGVGALVDALNADVGQTDAPVIFGEMSGVIDKASLAWRGGDAATGSKRLELRFAWCPGDASRVVPEDDEEQDGCTAWQPKTVTLMLERLDPNAIRVEPDEVEPSIFFACAGDEQCARPAPVGLPCLDQQACERLRDNLRKLVRFARGEPIEPPAA